MHTLAGSVWREIVVVFAAGWGEVAGYYSHLSGGGGASSPLECKW
jgi:hypothetical protein